MSRKKAGKSTKGPKGAKSAKSAKGPKVEVAVDGGADKGRGAASPRWHIPAHCRRTMQRSVRFSGSMASGAYRTCTIW